MIELEIPSKVINKARKLSDELGVLNNSITKGQGSLAGFVGELMFNSVVEGKLVHTYDYDIVLKDKSKVDVKTKRTTVKPLPHYNCTVASSNIKQACDYYGFVRVMDNFSKVWILGMMKKEKFFEEATFMKRGERDEGYVCRADCYNIKIENLDDLPK